MDTTERSKGATVAEMLIALTVVAFLLAAAITLQTNPTPSFLIPSETGPVHYPACTGPLTWSLHPQGITESGSAVPEETQTWANAFNQLDEATDYTFIQLPNNSAANISIHYTDTPSQSGLSITTTATGYLGIGGISDLTWSGTHWIATESIVVLSPTMLHRWNHLPTLRPWVIRHELGHAIGLGHQHNPSSTMATHFNPLLSQNTYQPEDFAQINMLARTSCPRPSP